jgi:hypothetical protein
VILNRPHTSPLHVSVLLQPLDASQMQPKQTSVTAAWGGALLAAKQAKEIH